eukprot:5880337-Pleurochrysis_carterae.AAC.1
MVDCKHACTTSRCAGVSACVRPGVVATGVPTRVCGRVRVRCYACAPACACACERLRRRTRLSLDVCVFAWASVRAVRMWTLALRRVRTGGRMRALVCLRLNVR